MASGSQNMTTYKAKNARNLLSLDTRASVMEPQSLDANNTALQLDFKQKSITGLTADYSGILSYRPYASGGDWTGGPAHQIAFDTNGLHWHKSTNSTTWNSWRQLVTIADNTAAGGTTNPIYINASGEAVAITAGTTGQFYRGDKTWSNTLGGNFTANGQIYSSATSAEAQCRVSGSSGDLFIYSETGTRNRGLYAPAHGTGGAINIINVDTNNVVTFIGSTTLTLNGASGEHRVDYLLGSTWIGQIGSTSNGNQMVWWTHTGSAWTQSIAITRATKAIALNGATSITGNTSVIGTLTCSSTLSANKGRIWAYYDGESYVAARNNNTTVNIYLDSDANGTHGIYSNGYYSSSFTSSGKWLVYRATDGTVYLPGRADYATNTTWLFADDGTYDYGKSSYKLHMAYYVENNINAWFLRVKPETPKECLVDYSFYTISPYYYNAKMLTQSVTADTLFGTSAQINKMSCAFMENGPSGGYCDVIYYTGYCKWGGTEIAITYNAITPDLYIRKFNQSRSGWGDWTRFIKASGDTMTGCLTISTDTNQGTDALLYISQSNNNDWGIIVNKTTSYTYGIDVICQSSSAYGIRCSGRITGTTVYGAVWNDYAECRAADTEPGRVVYETNSKVMLKTHSRLQPGCRIVSDTYGMCIGETEEAKTPIAVCGRVLVYPYQERDKYELGAAVCSGPNGTVDIMTREEIIQYPERIVGIVSEIPDYDIWLAGERDGNHIIKVNGRIWVYVK